MKAKTLNFNCNYNGKLWLKYFTTIRSLDTIEEKRINEGDTLIILEEHIPQFKALVISIEEIDLDYLSNSQKTILNLDYGSEWSQAADAIECLAGSKKVVVLTLKKIDKKPCVTYQKVLNALNELVGNEDFESCHRTADNILVNFIKTLGYNELANAYERVGKWYA